MLQLQSCTWDYEMYATKWQNPIFSWLLQHPAEERGYTASHLKGVGLKPDSWSDDAVCWVRRAFPCLWAFPASPLASQTSQGHSPAQTQGRQSTCCIGHISHNALTTCWDACCRWLLSAFANTGTWLLHNRYLVITEQPPHVLMWLALSSVLIFWNKMAPWWHMGQETQHVFSTSTCLHEEDGPWGAMGSFPSHHSPAAHTGHNP